MKTFKHLEFNKKSDNFDLGEQARLFFDNGYGISVITGHGGYSTEDKPYEIAVLFNNELCYTTEITDDVIGWLTADEVSEIMIKIQQLN